ncbi:MAG: UDP-2,3-diacylglucosamine diphosphatase LpxI [Planktomarina sp.]|jgi:UDP-2,3-diacylglucosamine hydrolase|nr:UDP-2,3-diacylglucosamine diphosphatase LpxI [Planktomarina sp.]
MLALICGQGALPGLILRNSSHAPVIAALEQFPPEGLTVDLTFRLETLGTFINALKARGVMQVCFAGAIRRPKLEPERIDAATRPLVAQIVGALAGGDDAALRTVIDIFEQAGIEVVGFSQLVPELLPPGGVLSIRAPDAQERKDVARAQRVVEGLSALDMGQGCVVASGHVLAVEAFGGTRWMLSSLSSARPADWPEGGLLYKAPKAGQERRIDLPAIGPETLVQAAQAGLSGVAIAQDGVVALDLPQVIAEANRLGLFLWVCEAEL